MFSTHQSAFSTSSLMPNASSALKEYVAQLLKWNAKINLISSTTQEDVWSRHIEDSLQLLPLLSPEAKNLADLGSGAGFPGMVIAIARPDLSVTLIEIDQRKSAFLNEVKSRLCLDNVSIVTTDIQTHCMRYDIVTARALASLDQLLEYAHALLAPGAQAIFLKGEQHAEEIAAAETRWSFDCSCTPSVTHPAAAILTISNLTQR